MALNYDEYGDDRYGAGEEMYMYGGGEYNNSYAMYDYFGNYWQYRGRNFLFTYIAPVILIIGTLGNITAFIVLQNESYRKQSTGFILSALAVVDTGMLNTGLLRHWMIELAGFDVRSLSVFSCRLHYFFTYFFSHASPMTIALMTVERVISVWLPLIVKQICTRKIVAFVWTAAMVVLLCVNAHAFVTVDVHIDGFNNSHCYFDTRYETFHKKVFYWVDAVFACFLPVLIIFVGNVLIILKLGAANRDRQTSMNVKPVRRAGSNVGTPKSTTVMLVSVSIVFLLCTLPVSIYLIGTGDRAWWPESTPEEVASLDLAYAITNMIFYTNNAINFPLYCLTGSRFRRVLRTTLCGMSKAFRTPKSSYIFTTDTSLSSRSSKRFPTSTASESSPV